MRYVLSLAPVIFLMAFLGIVIHVYGTDALSGGSQLALILSTGVCGLIAVLGFHVPWKTLETEINNSIGSVGTAIVILLLIGLLSGTWTVSGVVPTLIYWGMKIINPYVFLLCCCVISGFVSVMTGSSWTTVATIGIALMGIGKALGFSDGWTAGAILSGAYFGDKISPLSDTTVMASSMNKVPLFEHIGYMLFTTVPSITITLIIFLIIGLTHTGTDADTISKYTDLLGARFNLTPWLLVTPILTAVMIAKKMPALAVLGLSTVLAAITAVVFQPDIIREIGSRVASGSDGKIMFTGMVQTIYDTVGLETGDPEVNELVTSRGMVGMLNTVYLIICAMCFGAAMKAGGMLRNIAKLIIPFSKHRGSLVASTVVTGTTLNGIVSDQYLSIILTSSVFKDVYDKEGYESRLLSRTVEDSATVTSPLFPWSSCGMTQATILSVPTITYLPYCFFNIISPFMSIIIALTGYKVVRAVKEKARISSSA